MKKIFNFVLAGAAIIALSVACSKEIDTLQENLKPGENTQQVNPVAKTITITAILSDAATKVSFDPAFDSGHKPTGMAHKWETGDKLRVTDESNTSVSAVFDLISGEGTDKGVFQGTIADAASYAVEVIPAGTPSEGNTQTQAKDGDTSHLKYVASASGVTDLKGFTLSETSGIIGFIAKLPAGAAATINQLINEKSEDDFATKQTLTINLTAQEDANTDDILEVYANVPSGWTIAANTKMFLRFGSTNTSHTVYTRYQVFSSAVAPVAGKFNYIKMNCVHIDQYAGGSDAGTAAAPYLIADPYQVAAINSLATGGQTTYFKMIDNVDMTDVTHNHINTNSGYTQEVNFNGNHKTISNLTKDLFYVFKGSVYDLTLDGSSVTSRGILAEYCQGSGNTITNVTISNGEVDCQSDNVGGLIGQINSGVSGQTTATITNCTVSNTNVKGAKVVGGFVGYANELVSISGCKYVKGTVTASGQYVGGFVGSTGDFLSTVTNCQVEESTINVNHTADARGGGFVGQLQNNVTISGCTVGTSLNSVTINTKEPTKTDDKYNVINSGGFVGVCYGKITKSGDVRSKAYVKITSTNNVGTPLKLGGFVGFHAGNIEYSDAIVDMASLKGQHIGGFAGYATKNNAVRLGRLDNCTADGTVTGNNYTGGFVGYVDASSPEISNCSASGSVTAQSGCGGFVGQTMTGIFTNCSASMICSFSGTNNGGFVGQIHGGTMTGCSSTGSITSTGTSGSTYGGFVGLITNNGTTLDKCSSSCNVTNEKGSYNGGFGGIIEKGTVLIKRCYASGSVTSDKTYAAGFIGNIHHASNVINVTIQNCYSTGNIIKSNQIRGGFIAQVSTVTSATISNCYAAGAVVGSFRLGGLIGNVGAANITVDHCAAWNSEVTASSYGQANWSSGAVVGTAFPSCTLTDNYRNPNILVKAYWGNVTGYTYLLADDYQHANVDASNTLIKQNGAHSTATALASGQDGYPQFPYHGKVEAGKTLSQLASTTLGWSSDVWDFTGDLPTLR